MPRESNDARTRRAEHEARERGESPYAGVPGAAPLATRSAKPESAAQRAGRGLLGWLKTATITLGVIYVLGYLVTVGLISASMQRTRWPEAAMFTNEASSAREVRHKHRVSVDPSVTPMQAGEALASMGPLPSIAGPGVRRKPVTQSAAVPWRLIPIPRDLFPGTRATATGLPRNTEILRLARRPLSANQKQALRMIGTAEVWKPFDLVARAGAVDILGGIYELPLGRTLVSEGGQGITRDYGTASLSRAAWHLSEGRVDSAEAALRSMISFGAVIEASALRPIDAAAAGRVVVEGYSALQALFELTGDPRAEVMRRELQAVLPAGPRTRRAVPIDEAHEGYLRAAADRGMLPAVRLSTAELLRYSSCGSIRGIVLGPDDRAAAALQQLRQDIMRFPSDGEYFDLVVNTPRDQRFLPPGRRTIYVAGDFMSKIYFNPQFRSCTTVGSFR